MAPVIADPAPGQFEVVGADVHAQADDDTSSERKLMHASA